MNRSSGLWVSLWENETANHEFRSHLSSQAIAFHGTICWFWVSTEELLQWSKIFMAILQKQKEMFYWNNIDIRRKCGWLITAKLLSFSNNAGAETEVFHWFKTNTKCRISVTGKRNKTIGYKYPWKTIIRHKSVLCC